MLMCFLLTPYLFIFKQNFRECFQKTTSCKQNYVDKLKTKLILWFYNHKLSKLSYLIKTTNRFKACIIFSYIFIIIVILLIITM